MKYLIILLLFTSCMTARKAESYLDRHTTESARYCSLRFPVIPSTVTQFLHVDSSSYQEAYLAVSRLADSLMNELQRKAAASTPANPYKPNIDSLRQAIDVAIRKNLRPCVDSVKEIIKTVPDRAREGYLQGLLDKVTKDKEDAINSKDALITKQQKQNTDLFDKVEKVRKWKNIWFWIAVGLGIWTFRKPLLALLKSLLSLVKIPI